MVCACQFLSQNLGNFLLSIFSYLLPLFYHFSTFIFRLRRGNGSLDSSFDFSETEEFDDAVEVTYDMNQDAEKATEFRFPRYEEFIKWKGKFGLDEFVDSELFPSSYSKKYEVLWEPNVNGLIEKPEVVDKNVKDVNFDTKIVEVIALDKRLKHTRFEHLHSLGDSYSDGFLSDEDFGGEFEIDSLKCDRFKFHHPEMPDENQYSEHFDRELLEQDHLSNMEGMESEFLSENDFHEVNGIPAVLDYGDTKKLKPIREHQDLIEQLTAELRKARTISLPTILEESESPEMEDLKPWKLDESFQHEGIMGELRKIYKTYRERMRKFDTLSYQKMHAIGFLQKEPLKDPLELLSCQKSPVFTLKSLLPQNIWLFKQKSHEIDPMVKFIKELHNDLEAVYVGQMCLSWEFLYWQYKKALVLWDSDPLGIHQYNEVSAGFQQFMVLMLRFIEDEPFQGTRIQHYIKCRCDSRNLLHVPLIRENRWKYKKIARNFKKGKSITSDMLVEILEECIRIFWQFIKADKAIKKGHKRANPEVQNAEDIKLLKEVTKSLQKKQRKLKDTMRSENNILRGFRSCQEDDDIDHVLYFLTQVDMKLVSRVLNMSTITRDQLLWCHNKLSRISFLNRNVHVEPSFLLFPCSY